MQNRRKFTMQASPIQRIIMSLVAIFLIAFGIYFNAIKKNEGIEESSKPIVKIGVIYPMSGDGAVYGQAAKDTADMFFEKLNKQNPHFNYEITFEDNQLDLAKTASLANKLINVDKVDVIVTCLSNFGAVVSPLAERNRVLHFSVATDLGVAAGFYNFIASSNVKGEAALLYEELVRHGVQRVDIVQVNATGPMVMVDYFKAKVAESQGLTIDNVYNVNADEKDFRILLAKIKNNNPDYVIVMLAMPTVDVFLKQYREANIDIPFTGIETFTYLQHKELAEGMWYVDAAAATDDFTKEYEAKTGRNTTDYAEYMDLILQTITTAYEKTQSLNKVKVGEYVLNHSDGVETSVGRITADGEGVLDGPPILRKIENGQSVIVKE